MKCCINKKALKERFDAIMKRKKHMHLTIAAFVILLAAVTLTACALGAGRAAMSQLIEFEAIYYDVTEHSYGVYYRHGDYYYTGYVVDGLLQSAGGTRGLKEIGFAVGDFSGTAQEGQEGYKYRIFEREGYSIDEFIIVSDGIFMNQATIYMASLVPPDPEPVRTGPISLGTYSTDDGMVKVVLLNGGEFYIVRSATSYSPTGTWSISAGERLTLAVSEDERYIFVHNGGSITFQSGAWLENMIEPGTVLTLAERWEASNERIGIIPENINVPQSVLDVAIDNAMGDYEGYRDIGIAGGTTGQDAATLADYFVEMLNMGIDLTGAEDAMNSWLARYNFGQRPVEVRNLRATEYTYDTYTFEVAGMSGDMVIETSMLVILNEEAPPRYHCPYTYYYPYALPTAEKYLSLLKLGDAEELARFLAIDGDYNLFLDEAERRLAFYGDYDLDTKRITTPIMYDNDKQLFYCAVTDGTEARNGFVISLSYGDGLISPRSPF